MNIDEKITKAVNDLELLARDDYYGMCSHCGHLISFSELGNPDGGMCYPELYCPVCGEDVSQTWDFNFFVWLDSIGRINTLYPIMLTDHGYVFQFEDFSIDPFKQVAFDSEIEFYFTYEAAEFLDKEIQKAYGSYIDDLRALQAGEY